MSSPASVTDTSTPPTAEKRGISKYVHRMKTAFKRGDLRRRSTALSTPTPSTPALTISTGTATTPPVQQQESTDTQAIPATGKQPVKVSRIGIEQERARKLAERYGLTLEPQDWKIHEMADRVEKPIRMRIHRTCHRCSTTFGSNRVCSGCEHTRCTKCPRYPLKKTKDSQTQQQQQQQQQQGNNLPISQHPMELVPLEVGEAQELTEEQKSAVLKRKYRLTKPSRTGGQALVRKKPMQRVRRYCHLCGNFFHPSTYTCSKCEHEKCSECPRDPAKKHKYPDGYLGDSKAQPTTSTHALSPPISERVIKQPRRLIRYRCHDCNAEYNPGSDICGQCQHQRCEDCIKVGPKSLELEETVHITTEKSAENIPSEGMIGISTTSEGVGGIAE